MWYSGNKELLISSIPLSNTVSNIISKLTTSQPSSKVMVGDISLPHKRKGNLLYFGYKT